MSDTINNGPPPLRQGEMPPPRYRHGSADTSAAAARKVAERAPTHFALILKALESGPANPEALVRRIAAEGHSVLLMSIRPRCSQLAREMGRIIATPERARSEGGCKSVVYRLATPGELSLFLARKAAEAEKGPDAHG